MSPKEEGYSFSPGIALTTPTTPGNKPSPFFHFAYANEQYTVHVMSKKEAVVSHMPEDMYQAQPIIRWRLQLGVNRHVKSVNPTGELTSAGSIAVMLEQFADYATASVEQVFFNDFAGTPTWPKVLENQKFNPLLIWLEQLYQLPVVQQIVLTPQEEPDSEWNLF